MRLPPEVVELEQGRAPFTTGGRDHRRVDLPETVVPEVLVDRAERSVSNPEDRRHALGPHPQVADIQEELLAQVFLDRELLREVDDLEVVRADFETPRGTSVLDHFSMSDDGRFDERLLRRHERLGRRGVAGKGRLDNATRVPAHDERLPADGSGAVDPAS